MRRRAWLLLCVLLAIMCGLLSALWIHTVNVCDDLTWRRETSDGSNRDIWFFTVKSGYGKLQILDAAEVWLLSNYNPVSSSPEKWKFQGHETSPFDPQPWSANAKPGPFGFYAAWKHSSDTIDHEIIFPIWFPLLILLLLSLFCFSRWRRAIVLPNHCPNCGYDIRATPDRCPECGRGQCPSNDK